MATRAATPSPSPAPRPPPGALQPPRGDGDGARQPVAEPAPPETHADVTQDLPGGDDLEERGEDLGGGGEEELVDPAVASRGLPDQHEQEKKAEPAPARLPP